MTKDISQSSSSPDLATLATILNETAQALLAHTKVLPVSKSKRASASVLDDEALIASADESKALIASIEEGYKRGEFHDEIRSFHIPAHTVCAEYKLLCSVGQDSLYGVLLDISASLSALVQLMSKSDGDEHLKDGELTDISKLLQHPERLLFTIYGQLADYKLVQKSLKKN